MRNPRAEKVVVETIGLFRQLRVTKGLSQGILAQMAGVTRAAISHLENGKRKPSLLLSIKIAHALGMEFSTIIKWVEKGDKPDDK